MIFQYVCALCGFLFQVVKPYTHYKCPSCTIVVEAKEYKPETINLEVNMPSGRPS